jgi:hypothetical protein
MRISSPLRRTFGGLATLAAFPLVMHAHPGHDGHELTWDFGHLAAYPLATAGCLLVIAGTVWIAGRVLRTRAAAARKIKAD